MAALHAHDHIVRGFLGHAELKKQKEFFVGVIRIVLERRPDFPNLAFVHVAYNKPAIGCISRYAVRLPYKEGIGLAFFHKRHNLGKHRPAPLVGGLFLAIHAVYFQIILFCILQKLALLRFDGDDLPILVLAGLPAVNNALSGYKPISDDEGIDLIVKERGSLKTMYIQIKSRFGANPDEIFTATVKAGGVVDNYSMAIVFCFFDTEEGDLWDYLWFVPAPDFVKMANKLDGGKMYGFVAGRQKKESNKWDQYLIDKRDLANKILAQMKRIS